MKIVHDGDTLSVTDIEALDSAHSDRFLSQLGAALPPAVKRIDLDMSRTGFVDCTGLGALVAMRNQVRHQNGDITIRLLNPTQPVERVFKITQLDKVFTLDGFQSACEACSEFQNRPMKGRNIVRAQPASVGWAGPVTSSSNASVVPPGNYSDYTGGCE
jgi:anti-sigma B factor antagonist